MSIQFKSVLIISCFNGVEIFLRFFSSLVMAQTYGSGAEMDVYLSALAFPSYINALAAGCLNYVFIPLLAEQVTWEAKSKRTSSILNFTFIACTIISILLFWFAPELVIHFLPGFTPENHQKVIHLIRWLSPLVLLIPINELTMGLYYANRNFIIPSLNKVISPILTLICVLSLAPSLGVLSLVFSLLLSTVCQTLILFIGIFRRRFFQYYLTFDSKNRSIARLVRLALPLILSMCISRGLPLFDKWLASPLPAGSITILNYAYKLIEIMLQILTAGFSVVIFPELVSLAAKGSYQKLGISINQAFRVLFFLGIPVALIWATLSQPLLVFVFSRGNFSLSSVNSMYVIFSIYLIGFPLLTIGSLIGQAYYALKDTKTLALVSILEVIFYIAVSLILIHPFGVAAIPVAFTLYHLFSLIVNGCIINYKIKQSIFKNLPATVFIQLGVAVLSVGILLLVRFITGNTLWFSIIGMPAALGLYFLIQKFFSNREYAICMSVFHSMWSNFLAKFSKRNLILIATEKRDPL